jgi:signal transduction histidine kinase
MVGDTTVEPTQRFTTPVVLSIAAVAMALVAMIGQPGSVDAVTVAALAVGLLPWALVAGGVRVPLFLFVGVSIAVAFVVVVGQSNPGGMFPVMIALVWVALHTDDRRVMVAVLAIAAVPIIIVTFTDGGLDENGTVYMLCGLGFSWLTGRLLHRQQRLTAELREMNDLRVEHAASAERTRIAREVHDVVAHSLTVVMLHLTGARRALATDPERADQALARAEKVGRESLDSVRQVVGLLRDGDVGRQRGPAPPQPSLRDVTELIEGYRLGGLDVTTRVDVGAGDVDPATQLVVYRIVQESLSNVLQHAPGAACEVVIEIGAEPPAALGVTVTNAARQNAPADPRGSDRVGLGLRGMDERVRAAGGTFAAGPLSTGGWQVRATLPVRTTGSREVTWTTAPTTP